MKIRYKILLFLLMSTYLISASSGFEVDFERPNFDQYILTFNLDKYNIDKTKKNEITYSTINFAGGVPTTEKGYAEVPFIHVTLQISDVRNVSFEIINSEYQEIELDFPLLPSRGLIYRDQDPATIPYKIAEESIVDKFYPTDLVVASDPFILRSIRGINIYVYPFQYNAERKILRVYTSLIVQLTENNTAPINPIPVNSSFITREMHYLYKTCFLNYDESRFEHELDEYGSILVFYTPRDASAIQPWIDWKREKGHIVYPQEVPTGTNVTTMVEDQYNLHNDILYVQLVGDWPDIQGPTTNDAPADPNLGCVVGSDTYPDLVVGRFSASTENHVTIQVNKSINYELNPQMGEDWYKAALGLGSEGGPGDDNELDYEHIQNIWDNKLDPFTYDFYTPVYDPNGNATMVGNAINEGVSIINHCGHGSQGAWGSPGFNTNHVNLLSNEGRLPFIVSVACSNGAFAGYFCLGEAFLQKENGGAVGFYGSSIGQSWSPPMRGQDYIADLLIGGYDYALYPGQNGITTDVQKTTYGAMCFNGSILMTLEDYNSGQPMMESWHIFGDASLQVRTDTPAEISLSNQAVSTESDFVTIVTSNSQPVEGALVSLCRNEEIFCGFTDVDGSATIEHSLTAGEAYLTVTAFNTNTFHEMVNVIPPGNAYVLVDNVVINDSNANNNNLLDYGETVALDVTLLNIGEDDAINVSAILTCQDEYVTITDNDHDFGNIPVGQSVSQTGAFSIQVDSLVPDLYEMVFSVEATNGIDSWISTFTLITHAPKFELDNFYIDDSVLGNGNNFWEAGETVEIVIGILNCGSSDAFDVTGFLYTFVPNVTIITNNVSFGDIDFSQVNTSAYSVCAIGNTPSAYLVNFMLNLTSSGGITGMEQFHTQIGGHLIEEYFNHWPPVDWEITSTAPFSYNWGQGVGNNAGGEAPEAQFSWNPNIVATQRMISKPINTTGLNALNISFQNCASYYLDEYEIRLETTSDGINWHTVAEFPDESFGPQLDVFNITTPDVGSESFQIAWTFEGDSYNINFWYIDDVILIGPEVFPGYVQGNVSLNGGSGNVEDTVVSIGALTTNPDSSGNYSILITPGTYDVAAYLDGYVPQIIEDIEVVEGMATLNVDFVLEPGLENNDDLIPIKTELIGNYPNPFNPDTVIKYGLHEDSKVILELYNIKGQKVKALVEDLQPAGYYEVIWSGKDDHGRTSASGLYFYKIRTKSENETYSKIRKMILLK